MILTKEETNSLFCQIAFDYGQTHIAYAMDKKEININKEFTIIGINCKYNIDSLGKLRIEVILPLNWFDEFNTDNNNKIPQETIDKFENTTKFNMQLDRIDLNKYKDELYLKIIAMISSYETLMNNIKYSYSANRNTK